MEDNTDLMSKFCWPYPVINDSVIGTAKVNYSSIKIRKKLFLNVPVMNQPETVERAKFGLSCQLAEKSVWRAFWRAN